MRATLRRPRAFAPVLLKADPGCRAGVSRQTAKSPRPASSCVSPSWRRPWRRWRRKGRNGFYAGDVARRLVAAVQSGRRHLGARRSGGLPRRRARARAHHLSRRADHLRLAAVLRRTGADRSAADPGALSARRAAAVAARPLRRGGVAPRLSGSRPLSGRSGLRDAARAALARAPTPTQRAASIDPDKATPSAELDRLYPVAPRGRQHHALLGGGCRGQPGGRHAQRQSALRRRRGRRRHRGAAQRRDERLRDRRPDRPNAYRSRRRRGQRGGSRASGRCPA